MMKTIKATIIKFTSSSRKAPKPGNIDSDSSVAVIQALPGIKGVIIGMIVLSIKDYTRVVVQCPLSKQQPEKLLCIHKEIL